MDTIQQQFGSILRRRRQVLGLGQEPFADKAGLHRTHISLLERGKRMPSLLVIRKLAAALETTMASLMEELERPEAEPVRQQEKQLPVKKSNTKTARKTE